MEKIRIDCLQAYSYLSQSIGRTPVTERVARSQALRPVANPTGRAPQSANALPAHVANPHRQGALNGAERKLKCA